MSLTRRYYGVQALRGFAALSVVLFHAAMRHSITMPENALGAQQSDFVAGAGGVDIFFAISGFVIVVTSASSWGKDCAWKTFLERRFMRIVPLYWLMTATMMFLLLCAPSLSHHTTVSPWHSISSFLFIPAWNAHHEPFPLLMAGWTLSFEMLFYILFAVALVFSVRPVIWISTLFASLSIIGLFRTDNWGAPATLISPLLLEFVFGMWIGVATLKGRYLPRRVAAWLAPLMVLVMWASCLLPLPVCYEYRVLLWGAPGAILLASLVALEPVLPPLMKGLPRLIGDASYAIYLSHGFIVSLVNLILDHVPSGNEVGMLRVFIGILVVSASGGIIIHRVVEQPLMAWLQRSRARALVQYTAG